ncbi:hypothetical protein GcM1_171012, partial [Golovinomyces cichoracearum]
LFKEDVAKAINESALPSHYKKENIPLDTPIRWNSTFLMISIALELRDPLIYFVGVLFDLNDIFEILYNPSTRLQSELSINLNNELLYLYIILIKLKNLRSKYQQKIPITPISENYYSSLSKAINLGIKKLESYYPPIISSKELLNYRPYILGTILDPQLKTYHFKLNNKLHFYPSILEDV